VVKLVYRPEPPGRSDCELVHTENCSVPTTSEDGSDVCLLFKSATIV
jgi:hypothetical protein